MDFNQAVDEVISITKRPDKFADIRREVNAALNFCCGEIDFARDLVEQVYTGIDAALYTQSILLSEFPRFRKFLYIKPPAVKFYLTKVPPEKVFENCKEASNSYYISGDSVVVKTSALYSSLLIGYYAYPPKLAGIAVTFWLLDVSPYMIIDRAASKIFANIGDDASAKRHAGFFVEAFLSAQRDLATGYTPT